MTYVALLVIVFLSMCGSCTGFLRVCYHTNWSQYRPGLGKFYPENIDPSLCSHIIYAFAKLNGNHLQPFEWNDETTDWMKGMFERFNDLKKSNPDLKTLLAVGGWNMASAPFTAMVRNQSSRHDFATFAVDFLRKRSFDGLDLDWEYPAQRGSPPEDRDRFTSLVREVREVFEQDARDTGKTRLLLTAAVAAGKDKIDVSYDVPEISKHLDFINLMSYDLHGSWETITGHNSPLYKRTGETGNDRYLNLGWAARYWIQEGCPKEKLIIGLGMYGRSFTLQSTSNTDVGAPARGKGTAGTYTREGGFVSYYEVCNILTNGGQVHQIDEQKVPYVVQGDQWVGYDDPQSLHTKMKYIVANQYGGFMVWAIDLDDFNGQCGSGQYPLLKTLNQQMNILFNYSTTTSTTTSVNATATRSTGKATATTTTTTTIIQTHTPGESRCSDGQHGYMPSSTSCQEYTMCSNGVAYLFLCDSRLVFNPNTNMCDWPYNYHCIIGLTSATITTPSTTMTTTPTQLSSTTTTPTPSSTTTTTPTPSSTSTTTSIPSSTSTTTPTLLSTTTTTPTQLSSTTTTPTPSSTSTKTPTLSSTTTTTPTPSSTSTSTTTFTPSSTSTTTPTLSSTTTTTPIQLSSTTTTLTPSSSTTTTLTPSSTTTTTIPPLLTLTTTPTPSSTITTNPTSSSTMTTTLTPSWTTSTPTPSSTMTTPTLSTTTIPTPPSIGTVNATTRLTSSSTPPTTDFDIFCLNLSDGFHADPRDCHYYFHCSNNLTFRKMCGAGTAYKDNLVACYFQDQVTACNNQS